MFTQIISLVLEVAAGLVGGACLMRLVMQWQRIPFNNPLGQFVFAISDRLVLPLRRWLPPLGRLDTASLMGAWCVKLAQYTLLWLLGGAQGFIGWVITLSLVGLLQLIISCLTAVVLLHAVLSWIQPGAMNTVLLDRLCQPWLAPIRRVVLTVGGVDLSSLVLLVALQIASMVVGSLQIGWMH